MKQIAFLILTFIVISASGQVSVNQNGYPPDVSAQLEVKSTSKGFLPPRMTTNQRNGISNPAMGLTIFNTDCGVIQYFTGLIWVPFNGTGMANHPDSIQGNPSPCLNFPETFSVVPVAGASSYIWEASPDFNIELDNGNGQITAVLTQPTGTLCVTAVSECGMSEPYCKTFTASLPPEIPVVTLSASQNPACQNEPVLFIPDWSTSASPLYYQWYVNGLWMENFAEPFFSWIPQEGDEVMCVIGFFLPCLGVYEAFSNPVIMQVNPVVSSSLSASASQQQLCPGRVVTLTATPVNGGSNPTFQWRRNGVNISGATSAMYSYAPQYGDTLSCAMNVNWSCPATNPVYSNNIVFQVDTAIFVNHLLGNGVAPVTKAVQYGLVSNIPGEASKCWITQNLGADRQALNESDDTELSAGWYWQFNLMQGYKHTGTVVSPAWTITSINNSNDWQFINDPCRLELGGLWRIPTYSEWYNVDDVGAWSTIYDPWNSGLKMHAAGSIYRLDGTLGGRGGGGYYWSSVQNGSASAFALTFFFSGSWIESASYNKAMGFSVRCVRD